MTMAASTRARLAVLREPDYRWLLTSTTITGFASAMNPIILTFVVLDTLHSAADLGIILAAGEVPFVVFLLLGGVVADKVSRRLIMILGCLGLGVIWLALALCLLMQRPLLWELIAASALSGVTSAIATPTMTGLVPLTVPPDRLADANALRGVSQSASGIIGPALGGVLITLTSPGVAVLVTAICYFCAAGTISLLHAGRDAGDRETGIIEQLRQGWTEFRSRSWLAGSVAGFSLWHMLVYAPFMVAGALVAKQSLHGAAGWTAMQVSLAAGTLVGGFVALHLHPKRPIIGVLAATTVFAPALFLLGLHAPIEAVCAACLAGGVTVALSNVWWDTTVQANVPSEVLGRVSSYDYLGTAGLLPLGYILAGPLAVVAGPGPVLVAGGIAGLVIPLSLLSLSSVRKLTSHTTQEGQPAKVTTAA